MENSERRDIVTNDREFLGTEPVGKLLLKLAVPTVAAQIVNMLYNIVDRIYIGHMPGNGDLALTGVGVCLPIIMIVSAFAALASAGGAPRASIYMGQGDKESAEKTLGSCLALQMVVSAVLTAVLLIFGKTLLMSFGASPETIVYAAAYLNIYAIGTVFVQITLGMNAFITAQGFTKTSMLTVLLGAILNIVLDPIFIFAFRMGVRGAALATVISQGMSCIWVLVFLSGSKTSLKLKKENMVLRKKFILPCIALGLAPFIMQSSESIISVCFNSSLQRYGGDIAVGAMTILTSVTQFAALPVQGVAQGAQPISSYNYGAGNKERVKKTFFILLSVSLSYTVILWCLVMAFPQMFVLIFNDNPALVSFAAAALRIYYFGMGIFGIQMACQMTFISLGNAKASIIVAVVRKFVLLLPLIYIMPALMNDKTRAVYTAEPIADILAVSFTAVLFIFEFRKALRGMDKPASKAEI